MESNCERCSMERVTDVALIVPFYRQRLMLAKQLDTWDEYTDDVLAQIRFIVIDDGSPEDAKPVVERASKRVLDRLNLYRIHVDLGWNRSGVRNLGAYVSQNRWILNVDTDHVLPAPSADELFKLSLSPKHWHRFPRWRVGRADETRRKDLIADSVEFGRIREHIDSHLMTRELFMRSPYDEQYRGFLGGGSPFLKRMESIAPVKLLPDAVCLHVYTRHAVQDASVTTLSRDKTQYARLRKEKELSGNAVPTMRLDFEWSRVI